MPDRVAPAPITPAESAALQDAIARALAAQQQSGKSGMAASLLFDG